MSRWSYDALIKQVIVDGLQDLIGECVCGEDLGIYICDCMDERASIYTYFTGAEAEQFVKENWEGYNDEDIENFLCEKILEGVDEVIGDTSFVTLVENEVELTQGAIDLILKETGLNELETER